MSSTASAASSLKRILGATLHYGLASYLPRLLNFFLLPIYVIFLSPEDMGILEVNIALGVLLQAVSRLGLTGALARQYFDDRSGPGLRDLMTTTSFAVVVSSAATSLVFWLAGPWAFQRWLPDVPFSPYVELTLITSFLRLAPEIQAKLLQATEQARLASRLNVAMSLFGSLGRVLLIVVFEWGLLGALYAELAAAALAAAIAVGRHRDVLNGRIRWSLLRPGLAYGIPMVPHYLGNWLQEYGSRGVLSFFGVIAEVGLLGTAGRIVAPVKVLAGAFATALGPVYFGWRKDLDPDAALSEIRRTSTGAIGFAAVMVLGVSAGGAFLMLYAMPASYHAAATAVGLLAAGTQVRTFYNVLGMELLFSKRTREISVVFITGAIFTIALTAWLVRFDAVLGAAVAQLVGTIASVLLTWLLARKTFPGAVGWRTVASSAFACAAASVMPFFLVGSSAWRDGIVATLAMSVSIAGTLFLAGLKPATLISMVRSRFRKKKKKGEPAVNPVSGDELQP